MDSIGRESDTKKAAELLAQLANLRWWTPESGAFLNDLTDWRLCAPKRLYQMLSPRWRSAKVGKGRAAGEQLCDLYLAADEATREAIRQLPTESARLDLLRFARSCAKRIDKGSESEAVVHARRALASVSIEDFGWGDLRDTISALWAVEGGAARAKLDVQKYFQEAADYSSARPRYPGSSDSESTRTFLSNWGKRAKGGRQRSGSETA
jgi:hypothetical protein